MTTDITTRPSRARGYFLGRDADTWRAALERTPRRLPPSTSERRPRAVPDGGRAPNPRLS